MNFFLFFSFCLKASNKYWENKSTNLPLEKVLCSSAFPFYEYSWSWTKIIYTKGMCLFNSRILFYNILAQILVLGKKSFSLIRILNNFLHGTGLLIYGYWLIVPWLWRKMTIVKLSHLMYTLKIQVKNEGKKIFETRNKNWETFQPPNVSFKISTIISCGCFYLIIITITLMVCRKFR